MLPARLAGAFPTLQVGVLLHHTGVKIVLPLRQIGRLPIISLAHRRLSFVSGTKTKCRWGVFSSMCTIAETMFSRPTRSMRKSAALWKSAAISFGDLPLKNSGLAVISVSTNRVLSLRVPDISPARCGSE